MAICSPSERPQRTAPRVLGKERRRSLVRKLIWRMVATTAAAAVLLLAILALQLEVKVDSLRDRSLVGQASDLARYLALDADGRLGLELPEALAGAYARDDGQYLFQVRDPDGRVLVASAGGARALDQVSAKAGRVRDFFLIKGPGQPKVYAASLPIEGPAGALIVLVGQGTDHEDVLVDDLLEESLLEIGLAVFVVLAVLMMVNVLTLRRGLAPIRDASERATSIGPENIAIRLSEEGMPEEVRPLVHAVNSALDRLEKGFQVQCEFTADAAHELRTPLAVLKANLETLEDREVAAILREDVATMGRVVEQLLRVARLDTLAIHPGETADLRAVAADVASYLAPVALRQNKSLALVGAERPVRVAGNAEAIYHALRNLIENAIAHTPAGTTVEIEVTAEGVVSVRDYGPGVPREFRELIFQRFWRGDRAAGRRRGVGLGLAIVARTAEAYGGSVAVSEAAGGGARFTLGLPPATAA